MSRSKADRMIDRLELGGKFSSGSSKASDYTATFTNIFESSYQPPFDRHDWIVDRNGKRIRYVIDFYTGRGAGAALPAGVPPQLAFYLDVRPALDDLEGVRMRVRHALNKLFGFATVANNRKTEA